MAGRWALCDLGGDSLKGKVAVDLAEKTGRVSRQRSGPQELYSRKRERKKQTEITGLCWEPQRAVKQS